MESSWLTIAASSRSGAASAQPIGRMGTPDEVASLALFLCSPDAAFITGSAYDIDGGFTLFYVGINLGSVLATGLCSYLGFTYGWAYGGDSVTNAGTALRGKDLWLVATTGGPEDSYHPQGYNRYFFDAFLPPYEQTAALCGMRFLPPLVITASACVAALEKACSNKLGSSRTTPMSIISQPKFCNRPKTV